MTALNKHSEIKDFTQGSLTAHLIKFAIPVLLSNLMMVLLNSVDLMLGAIATSGAMIIGQNIAAGKIKRANGTLLRVGGITISASLASITVFLLFPIQLFGIKK